MNPFASVQDSENTGASDKLQSCETMADEISLWPTYMNLSDLVRDTDCALDNAENVLQIFVTSATKTVENIIITHMNPFHSVFRE